MAEESQDFALLPEEEEEYEDAVDAVAADHPLNQQQHGDVYEEESCMDDSLQLLQESGEFGGGSHAIPASQLLMPRSETGGPNLTDLYRLLPETVPEAFSQQGFSTCSGSVQGQQHQQHQHQQQGRPAAAGSAPAAASQPQQPPRQQQRQQAAPDWGDDDIDDLLQEQAELQQQQQQQQPRQPPQPRVPAAPAPGWGDDDIDDLLQEQEELQHYEQEDEQQHQRAARPQQQQQARQPWGYPLDDPDSMLEDMQAAAGGGGARQHGQQQQRQAAAARAQQPQPAAAGRTAGGGGGDIDVDLGAELDDVLLDEGGASGGGVEVMMDFDEELDAMMFGGEGAAGGDAGRNQPPSSSSMMPPPAPKPQAFASLGVAGAAAAAGRKAAAAAALAALQAAAVAPRQLVTEVKGRAVTVTGTSGARVYCQLAPSVSAGAAAGAGGSARGGVGGGVGGGGLLQQSIDDLMDMLAERRRQEVIAEVEAAQAAADAAQAVAAGEDGGDADAAAAAAEETAAAAPAPAEATSPTAAAAAATTAGPVQRQLWVDKYAPRSFLSLLSEPRVNREIAAWMARWANNKQQQQQHGKNTNNTRSGQQQQQQQQQQQGAAQQRPPYQQQQQQGGRGGRGGRDGSSSGRGPGGGGRGGGRSGQQQSGGIARGFDAARYKALQEARAAARVLLVVGPPGTGKTTLAHVIARHCGFRVVEVNASDARTAASLTRAVTDAAEMAPVLDGERRRPCIVLDELDGAAGGAGENHSAVAALVKLITGEGRSKKRKRGGSSSSHTGAGGLSVPVICTANDAYAPCLRPLKDIAALYHFKPPAPDKLGARLAAIAAAEGLSLDKQAVSTLVEHSGCDVRTAINTLQLLARQQQQHNTTTGASSQHNQQHHASSSSTQRRPLRVRITAGDIAASGAFGVKDVAHTPMGVVQEVLAANSSRAMAARLQHLAAAMRADGGRQQQQQQGGAGYGRSSSSRRGGGAGGGSVPLSAAAAARLALQEHYSMLLDLGEHEQVVCVLHESLPDLVGLDVDLATSTAAADALADADRLMAAGRGGGGGSSSWQYVPAPLLAVVGLVRRDAAGVGVLGTGGGLNLAWPRAQAECARSATAVRALMRSWRACSPAHAARCLGSAADALLDLAPALRDISRPAAVRAVNAQLLGREEERILNTVVDALVSYGITYSFPLDDDSSDEAAAAAAGGVGQRPAPLAPSIDTLHTYNALPQLVARFLGGGGSSMSSSVRAPKPGWSHRSMPLMLRQSLAQRISTAVITRLEQARNAGRGGDGDDALTPNKAAAGRTPFAPRGQQQQQQPPAGSNGSSGAAQRGPTTAKAGAGGGAGGGKGGVLPRPPKAPRGCWLDTLKVQAAAKRKAAILAVGANKRAALAQQQQGSGGGPKAAAGGGGGSGSQESDEQQGGGGGSSHNGYSVLYKFNEGYTNAVKRPIKMAELLALQPH